MYSTARRTTVSKADHQSGQDINNTADDTCWIDQLPSPAHLTTSITPRACASTSINKSHQNGKPDRDLYSYHHAPHQTATKEQERRAFLLQKEDLASDRGIHASTIVTILVYNTPIVIKGPTQWIQQLRIPMHALGR